MSPTNANHRRDDDTMWQTVTGLTSRAQVASAASIRAAVVLSCLSIDPAVGILHDDRSFDSEGGAGGNVAWARTTTQPSSDKLDFWSVQRRGANCQSKSVDRAYWNAAKDAGIEFIRLIPDEWATQSEDYLIGDADSFLTLDPQDLRRLRRVLDDADRAGVRVVLTMFSLPGARWRQHGDDHDDTRLWTHSEYHEQAFSFWRQLAAALEDHPAIVAYNPLNEPHPEREHEIYDADGPQFLTWRDRIRGTAADLDDFNRGIVAAIRESDSRTPVLLDGWSYATPSGLAQMRPVQDPRTLYAFHYYIPWEYTTYRVNRERFSYPLRMPDGWTPSILAEQLHRVESWAETHQIERHRIVAAEFGVDRRVEGAEVYLRDLVAAFDEPCWHWAFYAFRQDNWTGMDYELGTKQLGRGYWKALEEGKNPVEKERAPNPIWNVLVNALAAPASGGELVVLSGRVVDQETGEPVAYASVGVGEVTAISDETGEFSLRVPAGAAELVVSLLGYERASPMRVQLPPDGLSGVVLQLRAFPRMYPSVLVEPDAETVRELDAFRAVLRGADQIRTLRLDLHQPSDSSIAAIGPYRVVEEGRGLSEQESRLLDRLIEWRVTRRCGELCMCEVDSWTAYLAEAHGSTALVQIDRKSLFWHLRLDGKVLTHLSVYSQCVVDSIQPLLDAPFDR